MNHHPNQPKERRVQRPVVWAVRHAESVWNALYQEHCRADNDNNKHSRYDHPLMFQPDCSITEKGIHQCHRAGPELQRLLTASLDEDDASTLPPWALVVSPLRRALQTAQLLLQHCPQPATCVVRPECTEVMVDACDIGSPVDVLRQEFPAFHFENVTTTTDSQNWWPHGYDVATQWDKMRHGQPDGKETADMVHDRLVALRQVLRAQLTTHPIVVLVGHSEVIEWLTRPSPCQEGIWMDNCQILDITPYIVQEEEQDV